jgi:hypothetical protein
MEKKVATLEVYVSSTDNGMSSHLDYGDEANGRYKIVLNPKFKGQLEEGGWFEKEHPWDTLAHELGHFIARLAKRRTHDDFALMFGSRVSAELEAWRIAHEILPPPVMPNPSPVEVPAMRGYMENE